MRKSPFGVSVYQQMRERVKGLSARLEEGVLVVVGEICLKGFAWLGTRLFGSGMWKRDGKGNRKGKRLRERGKHIGRWAGKWAENEKGDEMRKGNERSVKKGRRV